jgi:hypothetical protein
MALFSNYFSNYFSSNGDLTSTPLGQDTIPTSTLTKAQKTFSSNHVTPNIPKPKTLYFVYFHLNNNLDKKIEYKQKLIKQISGNNWESLIYNDTNNGGSIFNGLKSMIDKGYSQVYNTLFGGLEQPEEEIKQKNKPVKTNKPNTYPTLVDYIPTKTIMNKLSYEISKLVSGYNKPKISFKTTEFNEYNRKRFVYKGVDYGTITISFYDVKDNPVQEFFTTYLKFICSDFLCKDGKTWRLPIDNNHWQNKEGYVNVKGQQEQATYLNNLNQFGLNIDSNFRLIDSISFCEYYMDKLTVYTIENPIITSIEWGDAKMGDFDANEIKVTFQYEGYTNDLLDVTPYNVESKNWDNLMDNHPLYFRHMVNREIRNEVATFLQTRYVSNGSSLINDTVSILKGYMNGDTEFSWNNIKNQTLDVMRKYGLAKEANTIAQMEQTINNYNSKEGDDKWKYLVNMGTDQTSLLGKLTRGMNNDAVGSIF